MNTYTPENLPITPAISSLNNSGTGKNEELLAELAFSETDEPGARQVLEQLDTIRYSPRAATLKALLQQINQDHPVSR